MDTHAPSTAGTQTGATRARPAIPATAAPADLTMALLTGTVVALDPQDETAACRVSGAWGEVLALRAASCQLVPEIGDEVLLAGAPTPGPAYVLAVLVRHEATVQRTLLGTGVVLQVPAEGQLHVQASSQMRLQAPDVALVGDTTRVLARRLLAVAQETVLTSRATRLVGDALEATLSRVSQWLGHSERHVKGLDQTRAGHVDLKADQVLQLHGQQLLASADKLARLDGDQVHIG